MIKYNDKLKIKLCASVSTKYESFVVSYSMCKMLYGLIPPVDIDANILQQLKTTHMFRKPGKQTDQEVTLFIHSILG